MKKKPAEPTPAMDKTLNLPIKEMAKFLDGYQNLISRVGQGAGNMTTGGTYVPTYLTKNRLQLENMYRSNWICGKVIDDYADDMVRAGISFKGKMEPEEISALDSAYIEKGVPDSLNQAIKWGRLYGGSIAVIEIAGQAADTPLRLETIDRGQFEGLSVYDRWWLIPSTNTPILSGPEAGMPAYYDVVSDIATGQTFRRIHHSRCLRFIGVKLPHWQEVMELMWGMSILERMEDRLQAYNEATGGAANLLSMAYLRTIQVEGLRAALAEGGVAEANITRNFQMVQLLQSIMGLTILDGTDKFTTQTYTFSGISDLLLQFGQQISGCTGEPLVRMFGQSPAGLSATGESDIRNWYDMIAARQNAEMRRPMMKLTRCLYRSTFGKPEPVDFGFTFNPLWQMSAKEKADIAKVRTDTVLAAEEAGVIDKETAALELRQMADDTGMFSNLSQEKIDAMKPEEPPVPAPVETIAPAAKPGEVPPVVGQA